MPVQGCLLRSGVPRDSPLEGQSMWGFCLNHAWLRQAFIYFNFFVCAESLQAMEKVPALMTERHGAWVYSYRHFNASNKLVLKRHFLRLLLERPEQRCSSQPGSAPISFFKFDLGAVEGEALQRCSRAYHRMQLG